MCNISLQSTYSCATGSTSAFEATINSLRSLLSDREQQLSRLEADLAVAKVYSGSSQRLVGETAQVESALRIELDVLRRRLTEKEAQVVNAEERLSRLEAVHRVAQVDSLQRSKLVLLQGVHGAGNRTCTLRQICALIAFFHATITGSSICHLTRCGVCQHGH